MKQLFIIPAIGILFLLSVVSCSDDLLETQPRNEYSGSDVWSDPALVETFINNMYYRLDEPLQGGRLKACLVDEAHYRGNSGSFDFNNSIQTSDNIPGWSAASRNRDWKELYLSIRNCNLYFENVDEVEFSETLVDGKTPKDRMTGEVTFLRAMNYFNLITMYGGVPIITHVYELDDDFEAPRNTFEECINFIVEECDKAADLLPVTHTGDNLGRATKGAALALKSRTLLYAASDLYNTDVFSSYSNKELISYTSGDRTARWQAAKNAAKAVIDMGVYSLYKATPSPSDSVAQNLIDMFLAKDTEEDIFIKYFVPINKQMMGLYSGPNGYHCWGSNAPLADLVDDYEMADGTRFDWNNPEHAARPYDNREPRFYANILYNGSSWRERPDDAKGLDPANRLQTGRWEIWDSETNSIREEYGVDTRNSSIEDWNGSYTGYYTRKYMDPSVDAQYYYQDLSWRFFRYGEILLNYAEACIELGEDAEACRYINMIRTRAGLPDINLTGNELREHYRHERRIELTFEEHRFFDVRRWLIAPEAYKPVSRAVIVYKLNDDRTTADVPTITHEVWENRLWNDKAYFFPILREEMNKNSLLVQNPGY